jgi:hypothetical protein
MKDKVIAISSRLSRFPWAPELEAQLAQRR